MTLKTSALAAALLLAGLAAASAQTAGQSQCWDQASGQVRDRNAASTSGNDGHDGQDVPADPSGSVAAPRRSSAPMPAGVPTRPGTAPNSGAERPAAAQGLPNC
jgi:hypothetical protein